MFYKTKRYYENFCDENELTGGELYKKIILKTKKEILEIIKSQNIIDLQTPSFLNITLEIKNNNDLLNLQSALENTDLMKIHKISVF